MAQSAAAAATSISIESTTNGGEVPAMKFSRQDSPPFMKKVDSVMSNESDAAAADDANSGVRILNIHEYKEAAMSLAEAFRDDDVSNYFVNTPDRPDWTEKQKWDTHVKIMEYITYAHLLKGLVVSAGPNYDCIALWMPPGKNMDDLLTVFRSGLWRLYYQLSSEGRKRFFDEFFPLLHDTKAQVLGSRDDESWYLVYIGTKPTGRGKGYARKVIEHVTNMADKEGRLSYLESSHHVNRKIYGKLGFEMVKNIYLQRAEKHVELDIMVRQPKKIVTEG